MGSDLQDAKVLRGPKYLTYLITDHVTYHCLQESHYFLKKHA